MYWIETEYRAAATIDEPSPRWRALKRRAADSAQTRVQIGNLVDGALYDVRVRYYDDEDEWFSPWATRTGIAAGVDQTQPMAPLEVRQTTGGCLSWRTETTGLIGGDATKGYEIRHAPGAHTVPDTMQPAHEGLIGGSPWPLCEVPGGQRTIAIRAVNARGVPGDWTLVTIHVRDLDDAAAHTLRLVDETALGYPSAYQGGAPSGSAIYASPVGGGDAQPFHPGDLFPFLSVDETAPFYGRDDAPFNRNPYGDALPFFGDDTDSFYGPRYRWIEYVWTITVDACEVGSATRLTIAVETESPNAPALLEYRRPGGGSAFYGPDNAPFFGGDADPFYPTMNEPWRPWPGRIEGVEPGAYRFRVLVPGGVKQGSILAIATRLSAPMREEFFERVALPLGGGRVEPSMPFRQIVEVETQQWSESPPGARIDIVDKDRTRGPQLVATDELGTPLVAVADVTIRGY